MFRDFTEQKQIPGLAYGVVVDGELAHAGGFGVRDIDAQAPVDADTVFRIASMTKSLTAMAVVKLRDEGRLRLDDPAAQYVPELAGLAYPTRDSAAITVRNLLTMSAGFPEDNAWGDRQLAVSEEQVTQWLAAGVPFASPPGVVFEYSNFAYAILGRVVANVAAMRCQDYVSKHILAPLGMTNTYWQVAEAPADRLAVGYTREDDGWVPEPLLGDGAFAAMAGLFTSIGDFSRYAALLLSAWPPRDDAETGPICRSSLREMQQTWRHEILLANQVRADGQPCPSTHGYGYGLATTVNCRFDHVVAHGGGLPGFGSIIHLLPEYGVGILAFADLTYAGPRTAVANALDVLEQTGGLQSGCSSLRRRCSPCAMPSSTCTRPGMTMRWGRWWPTTSFSMQAANGAGRRWKSCAPNMAPASPWDPFKQATRCAAGGAWNVSVAPSTASSLLLPPCRRACKASP